MIILNVQVVFIKQWKGEGGRGEEGGIKCSEIWNCTKNIVPGYKIQSFR